MARYLKKRRWSCGRYWGVGSFRGLFLAEETESAKAQRHNTLGYLSVLVSLEHRGRVGKCWET